MYFWLGLRYRRLFSGFSAKWGLVSSCSACSLHKFAATSLLQAQALGHMSFSSCGSQTLQLRLNSCRRMGLAAPYVGSSRIQGIEPRLLYQQVDYHWTTRAWC